MKNLIDRINGTRTTDGSFDSRDAEEIAFEYAIEAVREQLEEIEKDTLEPHLEVLVQNGAKINVAEVFDYMENLIISDIAEYNSKNGAISKEDSNEVLLDVLNTYDLSDDEDELASLFNIENIREAEANLTKRGK